MGSFLIQPELKCGDIGLQYGLQIFRDDVLQCMLDPVMDPDTRD
jgi:hypothetical protein